LTRRHLIDATGSYDLALKQCFDEIEGGRDAAAPAAAAKRREVVHDAEQISAVKAQLAAVVGPIAQILVDRAASRAESIDALYRLLSLHITNDADRAQFLSFGPLLLEPVPVPESDTPSLRIGEIVADGRPIRPSDLDRIAAALTSFIGPMAPIVARKEGEACRTVSDLLGRLAAKLHDERDRAAFLNQVEAQ
jgi:serine/threonine-protein kinase